MKYLLQALSFLTILPVGKILPLPTDEKDLARSMAFFPLIGLIIGLILAIFYYLLSLTFTKSITLWLTIGLSVFLTRGLHLDGFADTMDGLASGGTKENILQVMRDSRIGTFGVISLILLIGAKYLFLSQLTDSSLPYSLVLMNVMGRNSMVLVCYRSNYARANGGLGKPFSENLGFKETLISIFSALGFTLLLKGIKGIFIFIGTCLFSFCYRLFFKKRLGGLTGDILGGANELTELLSILLIMILEYLYI